MLTTIQYLLQDRNFAIFITLHHFLWIYNGKNNDLCNRGNQAYHICAKQNCCFQCTSYNCNTTWHYLVSTQSISSNDYLQFLVMYCNCSRESINFNRESFMKIITIIKNLHIYTLMGILTPQHLHLPYVVILLYQECFFPKSSTRKEEYR